MIAKRQLPSARNCRDFASLRQVLAGGLNTIRRKRISALHFQSGTAFAMPWMPRGRIAGVNVMGGNENMNKLVRTLSATLVAATALSAIAVQAQDYPNQPVTIV